MSSNLELDSETIIIKRSGHWYVFRINAGDVSKIIKNIDLGNFQENSLENKAFQRALEIEAKNPSEYGIVFHN